MKRPHTEDSKRKISVAKKGKQINRSIFYPKTFAQIMRYKKVSKIRLCDCGKKYLVPLGCLYCKFDTHTHSK